MNSASGLEPTSIPTSLPSRIEGPAGFSFAFPGVAAYAASKSGLVGLTQALAAEFGPRNVRVNADRRRHRLLEFSIVSEAPSPVDYDGPCRRMACDRDLHSQCQ
ncbi:NAD(P)-binding domain-containing protein [Rhizobium etli 8C-3]|uniref:NAD(P)-binding domain-containing protein n=1 Tax=Rhizobium etli 8C-3 TaxID=538025 RepID=A0A1L5NZC1_RHIET|nr:NAD(P)-binding domain-containing protein [Rhizobium etli 8C-3]